MTPSSRSFGTRLGIAGAVVTALFVILVLIAAAFPWGVLRGAVEKQLTARFGRPVTIGSVARVDSFGFHPTIAMRGVRVPQPDWAGTGTFATLDEARATFSVWPLITGRFDPQDVRIRGLRLNLVRDAQGRTNWDRPGKPQSGGASTDLEGLTISDSIVSYRDAKQDRQVVAHVSSDAKTGVRATGSGTIRGVPVRIGIAGPPIESARGKPWPFTASIDGDRLSMAAKGTMDRPLDTTAMTLDVTATAGDLKLIDAVIEAGLFQTQPVKLAAHVRHDGPRWTITGMTGTIGRSDLTGRLTVDKQDGRTKLDGAIVSRQLDFDDLASDAGITRGQALERAIGQRIVPNTRIDIGKITRTDGTLRVIAHHIVSRHGPSSVTAGSGTLTIDHQLLTAYPFVVRMRQGTISGRMTVDQRGGRPSPIVDIDARLQNSSLPALVGGGGDFTGHVDARARLKGVGHTIREAIGTADGRIGFVARDGVLPAKYAAVLGFDAARALLAHGDEQAGLRCVIVGLTVRHGRGAVDPLMIDTSASQMQGHGTVTFPGESLAIRLTGAPKRDSILRLPGYVMMNGTISDPKITVPPEVKSAGNIFKAIGRAIKGTQGPIASDADCRGLSARMLR